MYRPIESPCFLERGIPIGMLFVVQDAVHQALMLEAVTIDNEPLGTNFGPDVNTILSTAVAGASVMLEQTLDTAPILTSQVTGTDRQTFKGGILKLAIKIKGWEMPGGWKAYCASSGLVPSMAQSV